LASRHGDHFKPTPLLIDMAARGDTFYGRFDPYAKVPAAA
jgi:3-hydroxyacyl-CoA dehydrogenase/enoyl-CoA hydratase/3-hydroxybutyryl-CoA epimerase